MKNIYLDYAAATPAADEVIEIMTPYLKGDFGNTGSVHSFGQKAHSALDDSREVLSRELGAKPREIIFTGSATEANNIFIRGVTAHTKIEKPRIIISAIEHESVSETANSLDEVEVITIPVSKDGIVDVEKLKKELNKNTILVSIIYASNVIGTIQPIDEIAEAIKAFKEKNKIPFPFFHTDTVQAFQFMKIDFENSGIDALILSGQKIYGPKGVGALFIKEEVFPYIEPIITGGTQEFGFRAGTVNTPAVVGFAKAIELIGKNRNKNKKRIEELRDYFWKELKKKTPDIELNGSKENRLANNLNIYFPGKDNQEMLVALDQAGVAVSVGSACSVRSAKPSPAVSALDLGEERAKGSIRFTLGEPTTKEEIEEVLERIGKII